MTTIAEECIRRTLELDGFFGAEDACPAYLEPGSDPRLVVVTGRNAEGKSVFCRMLERTILRGGHAKEVMRIGMGLRTSSGVVRSLMFGNESSESTGRTSGRIVTTTLSTSRNRTIPHWIVLDEPDIGIGEGFHEAIGQVIVDFSKDWPEWLQGIVVVSHARRLVAPLVEAGASSVRMGHDAPPVADWIRDGDPSATVEEFLALGEKSRATKKRVDHALNVLRERERAVEAEAKAAYEAEMDARYPDDRTFGA